MRVASGYYERHPEEKSDKKNLSSNLQTWRKPAPRSQSKPVFVPPTDLTYVNGGKRAKRDARASKNGRMLYLVCVVTGDPVFDIGHFKPKSGKGGHDNMSNLIAINPSINRLMGDTKRPARCTFYRTLTGLLRFVLEPSLAADPYYKRFHNKIIKLTFPLEYQPGDEELKAHNTEFENSCKKICQLTSTHGGSSHATVPRKSSSIPDANDGTFPQSGGAIPTPHESVRSQLNDPIQTFE